MVYEMFYQKIKFIYAVCDGLEIENKLLNFRRKNFRNIGAQYFVEITLKMTCIEIFCR